QIASLIPLHRTELAAIVAFFKDIESQQRTAAGETYEGKLIAVLEQVRREVGLVPANEVSFPQVRDALTSGPDPIVWKDPDKGLGKLLSTMAIKTKRTRFGGGRVRNIVIPTDSWADLLAKYGIALGTLGHSGQ